MTDWMGSKNRHRLTNKDRNNSKLYRGRFNPLFKKPGGVPASQGDDDDQENREEGEFDGSLLREDGLGLLAEQDSRRESGISRLS